MTTLATDDFNRANANPLDGNWANSSAFADCRLVSNAVTTTAANTDCDAIDTSATWPADHWSEVVIGTAGAGGVNDGGPAVRCATNGDKYFVTNYDSASIYLYKITGGGASFTPLTSVAGTWIATDTIYVEAKTNGANVDLIVKKNGSPIITVSDTTGVLSGGKAGFQMYDGVMTFASWQGGDFGSGAALALMPQSAL